MPISQLRTQVIRACSGLLCGLSLYVLIGWAISSPAMVRVVPGSVAMSINTALMFLMSGICVALVRCGATQSKRLIILAGAISTLSSLILVEHIFGIDLQIDLSGVHSALGDGHAKPGRTSPNACIGFWCAGWALLLARFAPPHPLCKLALGLSVLTLCVGIAGLIGYLIGLDAMYRIASLNRMAVFTALGMTVLGAGLCALYAPNYQHGDGVNEEARHITKLAAVLLVVFAFATGLASFALLRGSFEHAAAQNHAQLARTAAVSISGQVHDASLLSRSIAQRPILLAVIGELAQDRNNSDARGRLAKAATAFQEAGFSAAVIQADGARLFSYGEMPPLPAASIVLKSGMESTILYWHNGFRIRSVHLVHAAVQAALSITTDRRLAAVDSIAASHARASATSDFVLCGKSVQAVTCFPSRFYPTGIDLPLHDAARKSVLPIRLALRGEAGANTVKDPRSVQVLAGYAPLSPYPLGIVIKTEVSELYLPLREKLHLLLAVVAKCSWALARFCCAPSYSP